MGKKAVNWQTVAEQPTLHIQGVIVYSERQLVYLFIFEAQFWH